MVTSRALLSLCVALAPACAFDPSGLSGEPGPDAPAVDQRQPDAGVDVDARGAEAPAGYQVVPGQDARWRPALAPGTLAAAAADCADDAPGAALALPVDPPGNVALRLFANAQLAGERIWLPLTDAAKEGDWRTLDGEVPAFTPWDDGEPNDALDGEDCAEMLGLADHPPQRGRWNDLGCDEPRPYVCAWTP